MTKAKIKRNPETYPYYSTLKETAPIAKEVTTLIEIFKLLMVEKNQPGYLEIYVFDEKTGYSHRDLIPSEDSCDSYDSRRIEVTKSTGYKFVDDKEFELWATELFKTAKKKDETLWAAVVLKKYYDWDRFYRAATVSLSWVVDSRGMYSVTEHRATKSSLPK